MHPLQLGQMQIRYAVREVSGFLGHSFAEEDRELVALIEQFLTALGVKVESGKKPEPKDVSSKVAERLASCELFIGLFSRRDKKTDGTYTTSPWLIEEKAAAVSQGKKLLLFVEQGVEKEIGGLQGDYEYVSFTREELGKALVHALEYVLAITKVPLQLSFDAASNKLEMKLGDGKPVPIADQIDQIRKLLSKQPQNIGLVISLSRLLDQAGDRSGAMAELNTLIARNPNNAEAHHELGHRLEAAGQIQNALLSYQKAIDLAPNVAKNFLCYGKCLYRHADTISNVTTKRSTLEKAKRLLERASGLPNVSREEVAGTIFNVNEALHDLPDNRILPPPARKKKKR